MWIYVVVFCSTITICYSDQQRTAEDRYGVHMNGASNAPPWQTSTQNGKMFTVPTQLKENDEIIIKGNMADGLLDIGLRPDGGQSNIVCQLNVVYSQDPHNQILLRNVINGTENIIQQYPATDYFYDTTFDVNFAIKSDGIQVTIAESVLDTQPLQHSTADIRYISVNGDVSNLSFKFNA